LDFCYLFALFNQLVFVATTGMVFLKVLLGNGLDKQDLDVTAKRFLQDGWPSKE